MGRSLILIAVHDAFRVDDPWRVLVQLLWALDLLHLSVGCLVLLLEPQGQRPRCLLEVLVCLGRFTDEQL